MLIAAHTMATPGYSLSEAIGLFQELGFDGVEIIRSDDYACGIPTDASPARCREIRREVADRGLSVANLVPYTKQINVPDAGLRAQALDETLRSMDQAVELGAPGIRVLAGVAAEPGKESVYRANLIESLRELSVSAEIADLTLHVENHVESLAVSAAATAEIVREVGSARVGVLYDAANLHIMDDTDHDNGLKLQREFISHVHVKDVFPLGQERKEARLMGDGDVPWNLILPALVRSGYDAWITAELEKRWYPQHLPSSPDALRHDLAVIRRLIGERDRSPMTDLQHHQQNGAY